MENFGSEIGQKMRSAVKAKLLELGTGGSAGYIDDELPDYVMIMVANKRSKQQMITDLNLFLGTQTELFVTWLHEVLQKLQEVTLPASSASKKRKTSQKEEAPGASSNKKDKKSNKKDKKSSTSKKTAVEDDAAAETETPTTTTGHNTGVPVISSITDVFAEELLEKAKKTLDVNADASLNIKKGKGKKAAVEDAPPVEEAAKETTEFDIPTISEISSTTGGVTSGNREKDLAELAEIQKKIYAAKKHLKNLEHYEEAESDDEDFLNLKDDGSAEEFNEAGDLVKKKSSKPKSPIVFDPKELEKNDANEVDQPEEQPAQSRRRRITPPPSKSPIVVASSMESKRVSSPPSARNRSEEVHQRRSRERERRDPPTQASKRRSVHERLGLKGQIPPQPSQREETTRERRVRQEKELYVPAFRRREIESEREREKDKDRGREHERDRDRARERGRDRDRERDRDRSSTRRRSSPERPTSSSSKVTNGRQRSRSQNAKTPTSAERRRKRDSSGGGEEETRTQRQRIGSRVIVATSKPPEPSDDEDFADKPVNSVIKIKPRTPVSPSKQACKNLLLRAVAEAQRSTILTKPKTSESGTKVTVVVGDGAVNERNTKLYTKSYRDRLKRSSVVTSSALFRRSAQNLVIEVEGEEITTSSLRGKRRRRNSPVVIADGEEEYVPESVSDRGESDVDFVYVPQVIANVSADEQDEDITYHINEEEFEEEHVSVNNLDMEKTQFVVTLNDDKALPKFKGVSRSVSNSPLPQVSSSSTARNNGVEASSTTHSKRSRSRDRRRSDIKSRLHHKPSTISASTAARLTERESTNSSMSSNNTPPPPKRTELIEVYRKPKEIQKIIIKNDSEDEDLSPKKSPPNEKHESRSKQKRKSEDKAVEERSTTPPLPQKQMRRSAGSAEKQRTPSPKRTPVKRKRTPIKFDLNKDIDAKDNRSREDDRRNGAPATKRRSRSYERESSHDRRSGDEYHHSRHKISIRNTEAKKYDNIPSLSAVSINSTSMKDKPKERCKYHPNCTKHNCDFYHPSAPCKSFPNCKFADKCMYSHPKCKYDMTCTNIDCNFSHSGTRNPSILQPTAPPLSSHVVPVQNYKSISAAPAASSTMCKYYPNCTKIGCTFFHPKPCRFGKNCINKLECNFYHPELQSSSKFKWIATVV